MPRPFTARQQAQNRAFLAALGTTGNARLAARSLGVHRSTYTKRRARCPAFAARWDAELAAVDARLAAPAHAEPAARGRSRGGELTVVRLANGRCQARRAPPGRITRAAELIFLEALSASANVRLAAAVAGFSHAAFYHRKRTCPAFAAEMSEALSIGYVRVEAALYQSFDRLAGPAFAESEAEWLERIGDCPLPAMTVDQAIQLLAMHRRTCREGWEHRKSPYRVASTHEVRHALEVALARVRPPSPAPRPTWRRADTAAPPPLPPLETVTGWSKATGRPPHNPNRALFGGWRIGDRRKRRG